MYCNVLYCSTVQYNTYGQDYRALPAETKEAEKHLVYVNRAVYSNLCLNKLGPTQVYVCVIARNIG